jgi:hypothetical protein
MVPFGESRPPNRTWHKFGYLLILLIISSTVSIFVISTALVNSLHSGRLSVPPEYDDVSYLFWSQSVLHAATHQSVSATAYQLINQHSPLTTLFGFIGYSLVTSGDMGPYIAAASHLLFFFFACVLLIRRLPITAIIGIACAIGAILALRNFATEFRPEPAWASLTAVSVIAFFALDMFNVSWIKSIALGLLVGLAVISKPTTSPVTIVVLGAAFVGSALAQYLERRVGGSAPALRAVILGAVIILATSLLVIVPVGVTIGSDIYNYIVWIEQDISDQVSIHSGIVEQALYYSFGSGGQVMLGRALPVMLTMWALGISYSAIWRRSLLPRLFALFGVVLISYIVPSVSTVKCSFWFGSAFDSILIIATVYLIALLYEPFAASSSRHGARAVISAIIGLAGTGAVLVCNLSGTPSTVFQMDPVSRADITDRTARIWSILRDRELARIQSAPPGHVSNVMTIATRPIVGYVISFYGVKEELPIRDFALDYAHTVDELMVKLSEVDYVVVEPSFEHSLSGAGLGNSLIDAMDVRPDFLLVASIPLREPDTVAKIYERRVFARS